jgi:chromosomal replication initiation ATPase DnaA
MPPHYDAAGFLPAPSNRDALAWLEDPAAWPGRRLAVHGAAGSGKTHLLHMFAERHGAALLLGEALRGLPDVPEQGAVAIDDADVVPEPTALLHLLNAAAERAQPVLLAGSLAPSRWGVILPDLVSRLRATATVAIGLPDDGLLRALLARLIAERQLRVDAPVQDWLLTRLPRSGAAMREAAACLDRVSLAAGGRVTRMVAAEVLARMGAADDEDYGTASVRASSEGPLLL